MAPTPRRELNILLTGFGPFMSVGNNPSWLAVKPLHNTLLDLSTSPTLSPPGSSTAPASESGGQRVQARVQTLQVPVHYGSVLDLVPRLHGQTPPPEAEFWHDPRLDPDFGGKVGEHYPDAYPFDAPPDGWDVVIHVGVGRGGSIRCETQAHQYSYGKPDAHTAFAPRITLSSTELERLNPKYLDQDGHPRGFPSSYEGFNAIESTPVPVSSLIASLHSCGVRKEELQQSFDPGRYLCDYIFYCSLCEAKRDGRGTLVLFVHVPPAEDVGVERCSEVIRGIAWFVAKQRADQMAKESGA
ncbi:Peptidase C15, pyroglutamyl peptidase I-like protein [Kalmanozyma brasiliensis GHG001]|uniref:Peptidase C15, pyroglutamyl peptidase I-like protein n=1 Tax=Kalmanozyma brasiliensis (strain GHG001) TaxID=1365824 RepID=V5GII2_KALBG|nr:Peptidase C15, pyroglutamyl peptidase I-like protein [Kalmanozyma brasiliensis GHG001]EST05792.1 Peptidase C15, pyroglutamyl peptidase I-like protein [Kalmanozyma brasiliensis GHG001]